MAILETKLNEEFHPNGQLAYTENVATLVKGTEDSHPNSRIGANGVQWIRTGRHAKYFDNGQLAWELFYDDQGNVIKDKPHTPSKSYRKDGTLIVY